MMGDTFRYVAPLACSLGFSVDDISEAIGLLPNAGNKSSQAGTTIRTILNSLTSSIKIIGENLGDVRYRPPTRTDPRGPLRYPCRLP